jgi:hypothetical protein
MVFLVKTDGYHKKQKKKKKKKKKCDTNKNAILK